MSQTTDRQTDGRNAVAKSATASTAG